MLIFVSCRQLLNGLLLLVVSSTRQGSINWLVCVYCGYNVICLMRSHWTSLFKNFYAKPTFLCWHRGWSLPGCLSSSVILLHPKLRLHWYYHDYLIHSSKSWEPDFYTKYSMPAVTRYWTRATGVAGRFVNHYTITNSHLLQTKLSILKVFFIHNQLGNHLYFVPIVVMVKPLMSIRTDYFQDIAVGLDCFC